MPALRLGMPHGRLPQAATGFPHQSEIGNRKSAIAQRRAVILPVILLILILLGLLSAAFAFRTQAELQATNARSNEMQMREAAFAGIQKVMLMLRTQRTDVDAWYDNEEELHRVIVWSSTGGPTAYGTTTDDDDGSPAFRFSIVADFPDDDEFRVRYGVTDESAKLNINHADREQLTKLLEVVAPPETIVEDLVDALLDWRDNDDVPEEYGAESEYYATLEPPYRPKNAPFDTPEELLLVKGFDGRVLYGEDYDRNGLMSLNEDDGDTSFPPDNADGKLDRGLYPYITVLSRDLNRANDNKPRTNLRGNREVLETALDEAFEGDQTKIAFVLEAINDREELPADESNDPDGGAQGNDREGRSGERADDAAREGDSRSGEQGGADSDQKADEASGGGQPGEQTGGDRPSRGGSRGGGASGGAPGQQPGGEANPPRRPGGRRQPAQPATPRGGSDDPNSGKSAAPRSQQRQPREGRSDGNIELPAGVNDDDVITDEELRILMGQVNPPQPNRGEGDPSSQPSGGNNNNGNNGGGQGPLRVQCPADLLRPRIVNGVESPSPFDMSDLPVLMDKFSVTNDLELIGVININTAPVQVLATLPGVDDALANAIVVQRAALDSVTKETTAWLLTQGVMDFDQFRAVAPHITASGRQFTVEALGYADHIGSVTRLQAIIEMRGPIAQIVYYRDLTALGAPFPLRGKRGEYDLAGVHN